MFGPKIRAASAQLGGLCDTRTEMDSPQKRRWWLIGVAALLAAIFLRDAFGSWTAAVVIAASVAALAGYHWSKGKKPPAPRCLNCGEALNPRARQCASCGSARWTLIN
jgi:hypothetical protein